MAAVCQRNKYGFCKFGLKCRFKHDDNLCEINNCEIFACEKRHPRKCTYFKDFGCCKFSNYCKYSHETSESRTANEIIALKHEVKALKDIIKAK